MRVLATGSFMVGQHGPSQQPFVAFGIVPLKPVTTLKT